MIKHTNFDSYSIRFEGGDTFFVKTQITKNDSIMKYMRYRKNSKTRYRRRSISTLKLSFSNFQYIPLKLGPQSILLCDKKFFDLRPPSPYRLELHFVL